MTRADAALEQPLHEPMPTQSSLSPLKRELRRLLPSYGLLLLLSIFIELLFLVTPLYMMQISERVLLSQNRTTLFFITAIAAFLIVVWTALEFVRSRVIQRLAVNFDRTVGRRIFMTLHKGSRRSLKAPAASLLADFNLLRDAMGSSLVAAAFDLLLIPIAVTVLFLLHPVFGFVSLAIIVLTAGLSVINQAVVNGPISRSQHAANKETELSAAVGRNSEPARVMGMLPALAERWDHLHAEVLGWQTDAQSKSAVLSAFIRLLRKSSQIVILCLGALLYLNREIGQGTMFAAMIIASRGLGPIEQLFAGWRTVTRAKGAFERLDAIVTEDDSHSRLKLPKPSGNLAMSHVFAQPPGRDKVVLSDVTLKLQAGRVLGVVGQSGAGKSCLARLLVGAWSPLRGTVTLDDHDLAHWDQDDLGRHIGFMPQDVELLPGTIAENIARFQDDPDQTDHVLEAAALAGVERLIQSLPGGYNTKVGPDGHVLSGGQRQRIALARAVYRRPSLVVLDEPNSNLDANGEEALGQAIQRLREKGSTVVVITHKLNMLVFCDDVLVLHEGGVHAHGSRDEIMNRLPAQRLTTLRAVGSAGAGTA